MSASLLPNVSAEIILGIAIGTVGTVTRIEGYNDGSTVEVVDTVEIVSEHGKGWYVGKVLSTTSKSGAFQPESYVWGAEVVSA